jgi:nitrite reductase/ring-hydroxylating ferredoxin subunit
MHIIKNARLIILSLLLIINFSCSKKEQTDNPIPTVQVNFSLNPNSTEYIELNVVNGSVSLTGGYRGIIVFRKSVNEFMAYERACPNDWQNPNARINVEQSGITAVCPVCNSKFVLLDGSPYQGPSSYPLKQYQTSYDGTLLYVFN